MVAVFDHDVSELDAVVSQSVYVVPGGRTKLPFSDQKNRICGKYTTSWRDMGGAPIVVVLRDLIIRDLNSRDLFFLDLYYLLVSAHSVGTFAVQPGGATRSTYSGTRPRSASTRWPVGISWSAGAEFWVQFPTGFFSVSRHTEVGTNCPLWQDANASGRAGTGLECLPTLGRCAPLGELCFILKEILE